MTGTMRIGIDFDNTIICYDKVFCHLAKSWQIVPTHYQGSKRELRDTVRSSTEGDLGWQKLQGKAYGEFINHAEMFPGFKEFIAACNSNPQIELFIVSHKTVHGHFDEKKINLRDAARNWLRDQGLFDKKQVHIPEQNVYFETTREEKIARIKALNCTHFIDDLVEVLCSPLFPNHIQRFLFQPELEPEQTELKHYTNWTDIKNALFVY